jgi:hypothetical protein
MNLLKNPDFALALALLLGDNVPIRALRTVKSDHVHGPCASLKNCSN